MRLCPLYIDRFWDKCAGKGKRNLLYIFLGARKYSLSPSAFRDPGLGRNLLCRRIGMSRWDGLS